MGIVVMEIFLCYEISSKPNHTVGEIKGPQKYYPLMDPARCFHHGMIVAVMPNNTWKTNNIRGPN
jgi:hypothetical protein